MAIFTNQATLSYSGNTINSNIVTGNIIEVLSVTKTSTDETYNSDNTITYVIAITNAGTSPFNGITVTDNLGEYSFGAQTLIPLEYIDGSVLYYQNGVLQPAPTVTLNENLVFSGISVPAGGNAIIVYEAQTNNFAPPQGEITNTVTVTGAGISSSLTDTETISSASEADLTITKSLSPVNVIENGAITYTFTIQNTGNSPAGEAENLIISDNFEPVLSDITVSVNGTTLPSTNYTYNEATGEFSTLPGALSVPGATYTQNPSTGEWIVSPGVINVIVTGTI